MNEYLNSGIKDIISKFPETEKALEKHGIGCGPCNVGTCLLKDIVDIHSLSAEQERDLMNELAGIFYPGQDVKIPETKRVAAEKPVDLTYSPPVKKLVDEHVLIKRLIALIPVLLETVDVKTEEGKELVLHCVDFIRTYADSFHHAKEEDILFKYFDDDLDIVKVMHEDHTTARSHVKAVLDAVSEDNNEVVKEHLAAYAALLTEHIKKEDEILYPWMDRLLSTQQVGEMFSKFDEVDHNFENVPEKFEAIVDSLESKYLK